VYLLVCYLNKVRIVCFSVTCIVDKRVLCNYIIGSPKRHKGYPTRTYTWRVKYCISTHTNIITTLIVVVKLAILMYVNSVFE